jgi:hypothetical protein
MPPSGSPLRQSARDLQGFSRVWRYLLLDSHYTRRMCPTARPFRLCAHVRFPARGLFPTGLRLIT